MLTLKHKRPAVVIPVYKQNPDEFEVQSYLQCTRVLNQYDIFLAAPENLDTSFYTSQANVFLKRFSQSYFDSIDGYNQLMLSPSFYEGFSDYEYLLVYQLDCYVFRDELIDWCSKEFDYIGAPWLGTSWHDGICKRIAKNILASQSRWMRMITRIIWNVRGFGNSTRISVGNGGCSLRRVKSCYEITRWIKKRQFVWSYNEDLFWSVYLPLTSLKFKIPDWKKALFFSFDYNPQLCYELTRGRLPFAVHGWCRNDKVYHGNLGFWQPIMSSESRQV